MKLIVTATSSGHRLGIKAKNRKDKRVYAVADVQGNFATKPKDERREIMENLIADAQTDYAKYHAMHGYTSNREEK